MHNRRRGPQAISNDKPVNLGKTLKKMIKYLKKFSVAIIIALVLAALSSVFSIIGPNKLSDLTDKVSSGLIINKNNLELVTNDILENLSHENLSKVFGEVLSSSNNEVSPEDKAILLDLTSSLNNEMDQKQSVDVFNKIPVSIKKKLLADSTIKGIKITTNDKIKFLDVIGSEQSTSSDMYKVLDKLPNNIKELIKPTMDMSGIKSIAIFLLVIYLMSASFNYIQSFIMATVSNLFSKDLRSKISNKINRLPLKYFDNHSFGDILSRITNDVDSIGSSLTQSLGMLVSSLTLFIGSIIMMFVTNWIMALTAILSSLFGFIFMAIILGKSQKYFEARQRGIGNLNGHIEEIYSSHNVVKAYNGNKDASKKFDKLNSAVFESDRKSQFLSGLMPSMMGFISNFGYVCVCIVGALLVINGNITFGVIVAFILYVRLFSSPLSQIAEGMMMLQTTGAAGTRVFEFIEEKEMDSENKLTKKLDKKKVKGNIEFKHVRFGYDEDKVIIKDFNCKVKPGNKIAIVGPTGAGKTTMVNLLMKFYNINSGDILIDGISTKELTRQNIHDLFVMVLQDTWLFNGTIKENITYNKSKVTNKDVENACKTVGLDHFIKTLPNGYDTALNDVEGISAGQKQLLTIARGMIEDAPFLILDEATSSVDTRTEVLVQKAMDKLTQGKTSFIIAHRLSTIKNADLILVMNEGNIIEQGTHKTLMKKNGFYAELYNSQFRN